jgi:tetratricopeptide (TPR) repeat protein
MRTGQLIFRYPYIAPGLLAMLLLAGCHRGEEKKAQFLQRADGYFNAHEYDKAKIEYLALLRLDPQRGNLTALQQLGSIWLEQGAPLQAYPFLLRARQLAPDNVAIRTALARVLDSLGARAAAKEEATAILNELPGQEDALFVLVDSAETETDIEQVKEHLQKIPEGSELTYHLGWASLAARTGDLAYAHAELQEALKLAPQSARAHLLLAKLYALEQVQDKAGKEFQIAAELSPARSTARLSYAEFKRQIGKTDEAVVILEEVVRQAPDYLPAWSLLAETALSQGKFKEALSQLENVVARDPTNLDAQVLRARAWTAGGETKKALESLEHLTAIYPNIPSINYYLAQAYVTGGNLDSAASALDHAIAAQPDYPEAILLRAQLDLRRGKAPLVIPTMLKLLRAHPGLVPASVLLADAYRASGRLDDAGTTIRDQIRTTGPTADAYLRLGVVLRAQLRMDEARDAFEHASELSPQDPQPIEQLVDLNIAQKNFDAALQTVSRRFAQEPHSAEAYFLEGKVYAAQGEWDRAETALRKALNADPNSSAPFDLLISTYVSAHKLDRAISELEGLSSKDPNNVRILAALGRIYLLAKNYAKARDTYEKLLSVNPDSAEAMNNLAYVYSEYLDQLDEAYELAQKAKALQPNDPLIADTLGWTLYKRGDYADALPLLQQSADKLGDNRDVQIHFGMASYMMLKTEDSLKAFKKALNGDTDTQGQSEARRRMALLEKDATGNLPVEKLEAAVADQHFDVFAWMRLAETYEHQGAFTRSAQAYQEALKINTELLSAALSLARLYDGPLNDTNMAFAFAKRAKELAPNDAQVDDVLGSIVYQLGNVAWAYSLLQESARLSRDDQKILLDYAWSAYILAKVDESRRLMQRVIQLHPDSEFSRQAKLFIAMTDLEQKPERLAASEPEIQNVLAKDPTHVPALLAKAKLRTQRGELTSAADIYAGILNRYPDFALAQKNLAALYVDDPKHANEAYDLAIRARNALPDDPELAGTLAEISYRRQDFSYAIQCFRESARNRPLRSIDLYYLGMAQLRIGQDSEAAKTLEKALSTGLQGPMLQDARATVTELHKRAGL